MAFPNAVVRVDRRDSDFWLDPSHAGAASTQTRGFFAFASSALKGYVDAGRLQPFDGDAELAPGIRPIAARGHTPGHTVYSLESEGHRMVFWGDTMHVQAVQMPNPGATIVFDVDSPAAAATRRRVFADAAAKGYLVASAHLPFPGIGHLRREGTGYRFVPVDYASGR